MYMYVANFTQGHHVLLNKFFRILWIHKKLLNAHVAFIKWYNMFITGNGSFASEASQELKFVLLVPSHDDHASLSIFV